MAWLRLLIVFASIFCLSPAHSAATGGITGSVDEILIAVPLDRSADVASIASTDVRCYQRLPDHLLIGTSRRTLDGLIGRHGQRPQNRPANMDRRPARKGLPCGRRLHLLRKPLNAQNLVRGAGDALAR